MSVVLAVAGNGEELTQEAVDKVIVALELNPTYAGQDAIRLIRYMADELRPQADEEPVQLVKVNLPFKPLDEDDLTEIIGDTMGPDWTSRDAARAVFAALYGKAK